MKAIRIKEEDIVTEYTLNTWMEEQKENIRKALEAGKWVRFASTAIGHTRAEITERDGRRWLRSEYGNKLETVERDGWGQICHRLRDRG